MTPQQVRLRELNLALLAAFALVAIALVYWVVIRGGGLAAREDNPRAVEAALRVRRGRILDSNDSVLAETVGPTDALQRVYPIAAIGPAVGYYSFRYGTAGVERSLDAELRGETDAWDVLLGRSILHLPQEGRDVRLTLDAGWQEAASVLLSGRQGAALLLSLSDGAIRVMASQPGYDPNTLDDAFPTLAQDEAGALLNRATQGQYPPGLALAPFVAATLVETGRADLADPAPEVDAPVRIGGITWRCREEPPEAATLADAIRLGCPGPLKAQADQLTLAQWGEAFAGLGLTTAPELLLAVQPDATTAPAQADLAVLGQDTLVVSPLQLALAWMTLLNDGEMRQPRLVNALQDAEGNWQTYTRVSPSRQALPAEVAQAIVAVLSRQGEVLEVAAPALAGGEGATLAWYLGAAPANAPQFAVVVVVEATTDLGQAQGIGRALLTRAFAGTR